MRGDHLARRRGPLFAMWCFLGERGPARGHAVATPNAGHAGWMTGSGADERPNPRDAGDQAVAGDEGTVRSTRRPRTSDSRNLRCPPGVRMDPIRPADAHRV